MVQLNGQDVGKTGLGLMRLSAPHVQIPDEQNFMVMKKALEVGSNFWNSGEFYGTNLEMLNRYFAKYPEDAEKVVLSVKGAFNMATRSPDGSAEGIKRSIDTIISRLGGTKKLDLFECARVDPEVRIEDTIAAIAEHVKAGRIGGICLSECSADTIRRASKVHKIAGVEVEYSLFHTDIRDNGVLDACKELEIPIIAYSPVGMGVLSGNIKRIDDLHENDYRRHFDRFQPENLDKNTELLPKLQTIADRHGATTAQVALEWLRKLSNREVTIIPIPGTSRPERIVENTTEIDLSDGDMDEIEALLKSFTPKGRRYAAAGQSFLYGDSKA